MAATPEPSAQLQNFLYSRLQSGIVHENVSQRDEIMQMYYNALYMKVMRAMCRKFLELDDYDNSPMLTETMRIIYTDHTGTEEDYDEFLVYARHLGIILHEVHGNEAFREPVIIEYISQLIIEKKDRHNITYNTDHSDEHVTGIPEAFYILYPEFKQFGLPEVADFTIPPPPPPPTMMPPAPPPATPTPAPAPSGEPTHPPVALKPEDPAFPPTLVKPDDDDDGGVALVPGMDVDPLGIHPITEDSKVSAGPLIGGDTVHAPVVPFAPPPPTTAADDILLDILNDSGLGPVGSDVGSFCSGSRGTPVPSVHGATPVSSVHGATPVTSTRSQNSHKSHTNPIRRKGNARIQEATDYKRFKGEPKPDLNDMDKLLLGGTLAAAAIPLVPKCFCRCICPA